MTAEIAILNREAIAMAADSAATMRSANRQKILTSANKIFSLSKCHPVEIMVYGDAGIMGTPWEIIIKMYRHKLGNKCFDNLDGYAKDFISFIKKEKQFYPENIQLDFISENIYNYFISVKNEIVEEVEKIIAANNNIITDQQGTKIITDILRKHYKFWESAKPIIPKYDEAKVSFRNKYLSRINEIKKRIFKKLTSRRYII